MAIERIHLLNPLSLRLRPGFPAVQMPSSARRRSCASSTVTDVKRSTLPGRACPSFQNAALGTVNGLMNPPVLGAIVDQDDRRLAGKIDRAERIAVIEDVRGILAVLGKLVRGALREAEGGPVRRMPVRLLFDCTVHSLDRNRCDGLRVEPGIVRAGDDLNRPFAAAP